jgi:hypothetical protein
MQALQNVQNKPPNHAFTLTSLRGERLWKRFVFEGSWDHVNGESSAFGTMEHETWTSLEEDGGSLLHLQREYSVLFHIYKGKYKRYSYTLTRSYTYSILPSQHWSPPTSTIA